MPPQSKWDAPGVATFVESCWETPSEILLRQRVANWVGAGKGSLVDIGCGTARMASLLKGWHYTGIDESKEMLKMAKRRALQAKFVHSTVPPLPFEDKEFTASLCMEVLRHMVSYGPLLAEVERVTEKEAFIVDAFLDGPRTLRDTAMVAGEAFTDNAWSIQRFLKDVRQVFHGWTIQVQALPNAIGIRIIAP